MGTYSQAGRPLTITPPSGMDQDDFLIIGFSGSEVISQLFRFQIDLVTENKRNISFNKVLGQKITVNVELKNGGKRHFNGICNRISQGERGSELTGYQMEIVPLLWTLTKKAQSRIFQNLSIPDILKKVLEGLDPDVSRVKGKYEKREYCVQYRETDFNFASRLMEEEGIYYFFDHTANSHKLILSDEPDTHPKLADLKDGKISYRKISGGTPEADVIFQWEKAQELRSSKVLLWDHSFELPYQHLEADNTIPDAVMINGTPHRQKLGGNEKWEIYDYPGYYAHRFDGVDPGGKEQPEELKKIFDDNKRTAKLRMQEETVPGLLFRGVGVVPQMAAGFQFQLKDHFNSDGEYLITGVSHSASLPASYRSGSGEGGQFLYQNSFTCIPAVQSFRPARVTPKPFVQGSQAATVVGSGAKDEEILTDKYGRVKVQFHWDRSGPHNADEKQGTYKYSSCWVRVGQAWAGKNWGAYFVPRIGQELIINFLEGDPDQPIAVGSVYNADQLHPYLGKGLDPKHPNDPKLSGIKTNTTPGGQGFNELRFDDTKDKQQVFLHAERDMDTRVKNETRELVQLNRHLIVGNEKDKKGDQRELVWKDKHLNVKGSQTELIEGSMLLTVGGDQDVVVKGIQKVLSESDRHNHVKGHRYEKVDGIQSLLVGSVIEEKAEAAYREATSDIHLKAGQKVVIEAGVQLSLKVGGNFIDINPGGIFIQGTMVMINSGGAAAGCRPAATLTTEDAKPAKPTKPDLADDSKSGSKSLPASWPS